MAERIVQPSAPPQHQAQQPHAAPAQPQSRARVPEWRGHPGRHQMK
jgi:hypothetical protein